MRIGSRCWWEWWTPTISMQVRVNLLIMGCLIISLEEEAGISLDRTIQNNANNHNGAELLPKICHIKTISNFCVMGCNDK